MVAAIAALGVDLHSDETWEGYLRFVGLFVPIWWGWIGITWYATAFDTDDVIYRLSLLVTMLATAAIAVNVGRVKDGDTTGFVISYLVALVPLAFAVVLAQTLFEVVRAGPRASSPEAAEQQ